MQLLSVHDCRLMIGYHRCCVSFNVQVYSSDLPVVVSHHWHALSAAVFHSSICNPWYVLVHTAVVVCDILSTKRFILCCQ